MPDTLVTEGGVSSLTFKEPVVSKEAVMSSTPHVKLHPAAVDLSGVSNPETSDKEMEGEAELPVRHYQPQLTSFEGGARPKTVHPLSKIKQEKSTVAHSLQLAAEEFKKIRAKNV